MNAQTGRLIAFRNDRLGARLITLVNAMRLGRSHDIPFAVHWPEAIDVGHVFNDPTELFDADFVARHFIDAEEWRRVRPRAERIAAIMPRGAERLARITAAGRDVTVDQAFNIVELAGEDAAEVRRAFAATLDRIPFAPALVGPCAQLAEALKGATAYHIRRGDLTDALKAMNKAWPHKFVPDEFYRHHMQRELGRGAGRVVVFSDDADTVARFRAMFPEVATVEDLADVSALHPGARDLVELYAMSRCAKIVAPDRSAFSSTAADLGGAVKVDVLSDMDEALRDAAHETLCERLSRRPESFSGDGEMAQCLAHAVPYLTRRGETDVAAALLERRVKAGLNISFLYPQLMDLQHRNGNVAGVLATAGTMDERFVLHVKDYAVAEILRGYALIRAGDSEAGLRHIVNAYWHDPGRAEVKAVVGLLVDAGRLGAANFVPVDLRLMSGRRRRGQMRLLEERFPDLVAFCEADTAAGIPSLDLIGCDWDPLMRAQVMPGLARKGAVEGLRKVLAQARDEAEGAAATHLASVDAMLAAHAGDQAEARAVLDCLADEQPDNAQTQQRRAHVAWMQRDYAEADVSATRAAELMPDAPAMRAWAGMMASRVRDWDDAVQHLMAADAAGTGLAAIPAMLSEALARTGDRDGALAASTRALALAPTEPRFKLAHARLLTAGGDKAGARQALQDLVDWERAPQRTFPLLAELLLEAGREDEAAAIIAQGLVRAPDNERLLELQQTLSRPQRAAS